MNLNGSTMIFDPSQKFQAELSKLRSLADWLESTIKADDPYCAEEVAKRITTLGRRLQRNLKRHNELHEYAECVCCNVNAVVHRLDGSEKQICWEKQIGWEYIPY